MSNLSGPGKERRRSGMASVVAELCERARRKGKKAASEPQSNMDFSELKETSAVWLAVVGKE